MCVVSTPDLPEAVPERQAARAPDSGQTATRADDKARRRVALAASIFTPQNGTLGMPAVASAGGNATLGA
jgi:hypothetical protein